MSVSQQDKPINLLWEVTEATSWWLTIFPTRPQTISVTQLRPSVVGNHEAKPSGHWTIEMDHSEPLKSQQTYTGAELARQEQPAFNQLTVKALTHKSF